MPRKSVKKQKKSIKSIIIKHLNIYFLLEKPYTVKEIEKETGIPNSTIRDMLKRFEEIKKIKKVGNNKPFHYVVSEYKEEIEKIKDLIKEEIISTDMQMLDYIDKPNSIKLKELNILASSIEISSDRENKLKRNVRMKLGKNPNDEEFEKNFYSALKKISDESKKGLVEIIQKNK